VRCPVVLPFITKQAKVLFDFLVLAFHFAVTLRMVGSSEPGLDTKALVKCSHETSSKLWASIREDLLRDSMKAEHVGVMDVSGTFGCKIRLAGHKVALIQVVIDVNADGVEVVRSGKLDDEVNTDIFPECSWHFVRLKCGVWVLCRLVTLALIASENVLLHQSTHLGPPVMTQD
jgi:hypothetical protein